MISFRAKSMNGPEWVVGELQSRPEYGNKYFIVTHLDGLTQWHHVKQSTIGMCLDMYDKAGKPIYASFYMNGFLTKGGSLVFDENRNAIYQVIINASSYQIVAKNKYESVQLPLSVEVIGDLIDNKEFLDS
ncbi:MAG: hypothetical protein Q8861_02110 [Bacteroidota bacterium]|nr:hypothetical protein [Bacteroidota bacterium]